ncbi:MAG: DUF4783 domain-containing protein [Bacteroidetes bacterium]|nr:DUF4783 domain-containing protein [Bacteroidota bacterium]
MFRHTTIIFFSCMLMSWHAFCQADPSSEIIDVLRKGNSSGLGKYFNEMVDLNIPGFKELYSKTQAERIIKDFFSNKPVSSVSVNREGNSPDGSKYTMGSLTAGGKKYNLFFLLRKSNGEYRIYQLHLQSE